MAVDQGKLSQYLNQSKYVVLATLDQEDSPVLRSLGSFVVDGFTTYFSTGKDTAKVGQIRQKHQVSVLFQHENQELKSFVNVTINGLAKEIGDKEDREKAIQLLSNRNPRFKERVEKGEIGNNLFFRIDPQKVKVLDFSKGAGPQAVEVINL